VLPLIGITAYPREVEIVPDRTLLHTISRSYVDAVARAGGVPVVVPVLPPDLAPAALDRLDGLVLPGGGDVMPGAYGEEPSPETRGVDASRDAWELTCARLALDRGLPVLAICRGAQVLNVALGGSLLQHVPGHSCASRSGEQVHVVRVESRLATVLGAPAVGANSLHHQAVGRPGDGVRVTGWAEDGTVEGFEVDGHPNVLAVQWHPELLPGAPPHQRLFEDLVRSASADGWRPGRVI
jgi:putative glutamine amidotransferase